MKKLIFTLCAFITTIGLFAQSTEKEEYEKATAVLRAENDANNEILTSLFRKRDRTEADEKELQQRLGVRDSLGYLIDETILYALEQRKPPFSPRFVIELEKVVSSAYTWSNYYQGNYVENYGKLLERAAKTYERLPEELKVSPPGREMKTYLFPYPKVEVGDQMPDVELPDLDGVMHKLSDYKGKYILLDFWETGCGPCIAAMPKIKEIYEANKDILTVIGINTEYAGKNNSWAATSERQGITWPNLNSPHRMSGEIASRFRLVAWPLQVLVSPEGVILDRWYGFGDGYLRMQIQKYIPELK